MRTHVRCSAISALEFFDLWVFVIHLKKSEAIEFSRAADGVPGGARDDPQHLLHLLRRLH